MISVIIPTYNDENIIRSTIEHLQLNAYTRLLKEIIVVDGGSVDQTVAEAKKAGARVVRSDSNNRSIQMNLGGEAARGNILYFVTPGTYPPKNFTNEIVRATLKGHASGAFLFEFDYRHWLLNTISKITKIKKLYTGIEHQTLFMLKELFVKGGTFREDQPIFEEHELLKRIKRYGNFILIPSHAVASCKQYLSTAVSRERSYLIGRMLMKLGVNSARIFNIHQRLVKTKKQQPSLWLPNPVQPESIS